VASSTDVVAVAWCSGLGIFIAIWCITPPTTQPRDVNLPFGTMLAATALHALVWTLLVKRRSGLTPVPVEQVLEQEFARGARDRA
jgi:hypothetical protein